MRHLQRTLPILFLLGIALVIFLYRTIPQRNTDRTQFDVIIVLGYPANSDGTPSPEMRERVLEGIREFRAGVAPRLIMTGGAAHNEAVEAHVMAALAKAQGVPAGAVFEEVQAQDTIQNAYYSAQLMQLYHWSAAEIVSSPSHLPRASLIFRHHFIEWRMHAAPWPREYGWGHKLVVYAREAAMSSRLRVLGFSPGTFLR